MKILITAPSLDEKQNVSGISSVVRQIVERGADEFVHFQAGRQDGEKIGISWVFKQIVAFPRFFQTIRREKIDIVHINTALNPLSILRDFSLVLATRFTKRPILLHVHGGKFLSQEFENRILSRIAESMLRKSNEVLVLSDLEKQTIKKRWHGLNVGVLENAVEIVDIPNRVKNVDEKTIIFLGRFHESKGLNEIIETTQNMVDKGFSFCFKCFGAGDLREFFVGEMTMILGENFRYGGIISGSEKMKELASSDIFLLPSRYGEGLPMAMLEAMSVGCVVVVSEMASIGAVIRDGENGFLIEPRNVSQLVEKLTILLEDKADLKKIGENAIATVQEKFGLENYLKKLRKIYVRIGSK